MQKKCGGWDIVWFREEVGSTSYYSACFGNKIHLTDI